MHTISKGLGLACLIVAVLAAACSGGSEPAPSKPLDVGLFTFDPIDDLSLEGKMIDQLTAALDAGVNIIPLYMDWPVTSEDAEAPLELLAGLGARPFVLIGVAEGLDRNLPSIDEWSAFLDEFVPLLLRYEPVMLSFGNEVEFQAGEPELFATYISEARRRLDPEDVAVGTTFSGGYLLDPEPPAPDIAPILDTSTAAGLNAYCPIDDKSQPRPVEEFATDLDRMEAALGGLPIHIQETGCPSTVGLQHQANALELQLRTFVERSDRYESITLFKHYDFNTAFCDDFAQMFVDEDIPIDHPDVAAFIEATCFLGLVDASTGDPRPAWTTALNWVPCLREARVDC